MRTIAVLFGLTTLVACNPQSKSEKTEFVKSTTQKTIILSDSTVQSISRIFDQYEAIKNGLVDYSISKVDSSANLLSSHLVRIQFPEINDVVLVDSIQNSLLTMRASVRSIMSNASIEDKKRSFSQLSDAFYVLLSRIQFDKYTLYRQTCPMAFNDSESASWVSKSTEIYNPYLGKKHPKYAAGMLNCGEVTDSIWFKK